MNVRAAICIGLTVAALTAGAGLLFNLAADTPPQRASLVVHGIAAVTAAMLCARGRFLAFPHPFAGPVAWPVFVGAIAVTVAAPSAPPGSVSWALGLSATVAALSFFIDRLTAFLGALKPCRRDAPFVVMVLFALAATAPIWFGPLAEASGGTAFANLVVGTSPLTHLSVAVDYDYLRSQWFYARTSFGGLRYDYPEVAVSCMLYAILGGSFWLAERAASVAGRAETSNAPQTGDRSIAEERAS